MEGIETTPTTSEVPGSGQLQRTNKSIVPRSETSCGRLRSAAYTVYVVLERAVKASAKVLLPRFTRRGDGSVHNSYTER